MPAFLKQQLTDEAREDLIRELAEAIRYESDVERAHKLWDEFVTLCNGRSQTQIPMTQLEELILILQDLERSK